MSSHACEVHAEQGWCRHTRPDPEAALRLAFAGVEVPLKRAVEAVLAGLWIGESSPHTKEADE